MTGFSLQVYLPDGNPDGLRIVTKSHWTGIASMSSRQEYPQARQRVEFQSTGVYVLSGPSEHDPSVREIYVGEGDAVYKRINSHLVNLDFWNEVVVFTKTDGTLNKAHARAIEAELIRRAKNAKRCVLRNANNPSPPPLDEAAQADLESFINDMIAIFRLLGIDAFDEPIRPELGASEVLTFNLGGAVGSGQFTTEGFLVQKGARASLTEKAGFTTGYSALRQTLVASGVLILEDDSYVMTQDYVFTTPSSAGAVLYGGQVSGPRLWKYPGGESLKDRTVKASENLPFEPDDELEDLQSQADIAPI